MVKAAADRVAELEEREQLTDEQEKELAALRPKAQQWQKHKERDANRYRVGKAAADRVAELEELEELEEREQLTEGQAAELTVLRPKAQQWQNIRNIPRSISGWERLLPIVLRSWRSWRSGSS
ncbi:hypothetical protein [Saccharopolyspora sp. ASAGF58]|uniref:hypothetical protein n=1 Tax=Saccharopolyspora sp. ASAGF58 TaxID=2719023 RepID=UPI00143FE9AF|nr:hypothetical protein [Saccharopolyspora sp. ASAGF58]QIZ39156.1 hypothetical protein FDZ84_37625 [Saccharopolyspora sp. ASAGF58]